MTSNTQVLSAFDQGQRAGKDIDGPAAPNPFCEGSAEHNNFEVGRRFGAAHTRPSARAMIADEDEEMN